MTSRLITTLGQARLASLFLPRKPQLAACRQIGAVCSGFISPAPEQQSAAALQRGRSVCSASSNGEVAGTAGAMQLIEDSIGPLSTHSMVRKWELQQPVCGCAGMRSMWLPCMG